MNAFLAKIGEYSSLNLQLMLRINSYIRYLLVSTQILLSLEVLLRQCGQKANCEVNACLSSSLKRESVSSQRVSVVLLFLVICE